MTTASTAAQSALQGSSAWRLIVAVGLVLGATAFTVQSFVQSTGGEGGGPGQAAESDADPALELCTDFREGSWVRYFQVGMKIFLKGSRH